MLISVQTRLGLLITNQEKHRIVPINPISISGLQIPFSTQAEHVGVVRSTEGNMPHILGRITAHKKCLGALLFTGIGHAHRENPAASIKLEKLYGMPVLFSGLASLVLSEAEINVIDQHYKTTLCRLLKLHPGTPQSFVYFMAGSLPARAILHQRQLGLFSMICHLQSDPLNKRAKRVLSGCNQSKSWFT